MHTSEEMIWLNDIAHLLYWKGNLINLKLELENACIDTDGEYDAGSTPAEVVEMYHEKEKSKTQ